MPENTLAGLKKALELGADGVEFDVRVTKDRIPILCHDTDLLGDNGLIMNVADNKYKRLRSHRAGMISLDEALQKFYGKLDLYIEIKPHQPLDPIFKSLEKYGTKRIFIGSFDFKILRAVRLRYPTGNIFVNDQWSGVRATRRAKKLNTKIIDISHRWLWIGFIKAMKKNGFQLYTYNLDDAGKAKKWAAAGLAGVITNYPDRFIR